MILIKSDSEIEAIRRSGKITASVLDELVKHIKPGISTGQLDRIAEGIIKENGAVSAFKGYRGFPNTITVSINEEVVHGIPGDRKLKDKDVVSIDIGVIYDGFCSDAAVSIGVGDITKEARRLLEVTSSALDIAIKKAQAGNRLSDISNAVQVYVEENGFSVVRDLVGHGIGRNLHEDPQIPNFGPPGRGTMIEKGMVFAIEPMVNAGDYKVSIKDDSWTVVTQDGSVSAHFEHTVAITNNGPKILTLP